MSAEIICIGTELLLGDITNTNARYLAQELAQLGIPHYFQTTVGDNIQRIHQVIDIARSRSQILIFTGGLGPTPDDLTTEAIASFFHTPLEEKPALVADIAEKFAQRGLAMTDNNRKQALIPQGAQVLPNILGTAPGMIWQPEENLTIFTFPGVPRELYPMWQDTAVPFLRGQGWGQKIIISEMLRFRGIGESTLAAKVNHLFDLENPTVAPYASHGEVRLRISARVTSAAEAKALIQPVAEEIKAIAGEDYFGSNDETLPQVIKQWLTERGETLAVAESCTAGGLGALITEVAGSSQYFLGGVLAYSNPIKTQLLDVNPQTLETHGAVSEAVAKEMAIGVQKKLGSDWALSLTGVAGPGGGTPEKPVGLVYLGLANPQGQAIAREFRFGEKRQRDLVRYLSACNALDQLRRQLQKLS